MEIWDVMITIALVSTSQYIAYWVGLKCGLRTRQVIDEENAFWAKQEQLRPNKNN